MKRKIRFIICYSILLVAFSISGLSLALAMEKPGGYPTRYIEIISPWTAGGSTDLYVRTLAISLEKIMGKKIIIMSVQGGEGVRAYKETVGRPVDGYTLFAIGPEEIINSVYGRIDYKQLAPLVRVQMDQSMFWVREESPFKTFKDVIAHAKANPDKQLWGGGYGIDQVVTELVTAATGTKVKFVPYGVGKEATAALLGGHIDVLHEEPGGIIAQIGAKMVRPLLVLAEKRLSAFPDTPTGKEFGIDVTLGRWRGIALKKGTNPQVIKYLAESIQEAMKSPEYQKLAGKTLMNMRPGFLGPEEFSKFLDEEFAIYGKVMQKIGLVK